jgi:uncharacterized membrane protein YGL010W
MRQIDKLLDEYGESHRNPVNKLIHWICVPPIVYWCRFITSGCPAAWGRA